MQCLSKPAIFVPSEFFSEWDHFEEYDWSSKYLPCIRDFGHGLREYKWILVEFNKDERYAVACRIYTEMYLKAIASYCPCSDCSSFLFRILGYRSKKCSGCLRNGPVGVRELFVKQAEKKLAVRHKASLV